MAEVETGVVEQQQFIDPYSFPSNRGSAPCSICQHASPEALAFIVKHPIVKDRDWKRLTAWFASPYGGNVPEHVATEKRIMRHLVQCEGYVWPKKEKDTP